MRRLLGVCVVVLMAIGVVASPAAAAGLESSVSVVSVGVGQITLQITNPNNFIVCYEYRTDGDTSQAIGTPNPNTNYSDRYPSFCLTNASTTQTFYADQYVEIRSVFGAERDVDFDWIAFDVLPDAQTKDDCKDDGYAAFGFSNQGQCIRFVNTGKDSR